MCQFQRSKATKLLQVKRKKIMLKEKFKGGEKRG
jgi:hypothetical protein